MSNSVDTAFVKEFADDVHDAFQQQGSKLTNTVRKKNGVVGSSATFQRIGTGEATTKARHGTVTPMNVNHTAFECTLSDYYAGDWVDKLDEIKLNTDERKALVRAGANGLGRKADSLIITKLDDTSNTVTIAGPMARKTLLEAVETLNGNDVPDDGLRFGLLTPRQWSHALGIAEFSSADFVGADLPFMNRQDTRRWMNINWLMHTGLTGGGSATAKGKLYHQSAIGLAIGANVTSDIAWQGDRAAHFVNSWMSMGACLIDDQGVVTIQSDDTAAIA